MIKKTIWEILEIEPTDDKKIIKRAYAKKCARYHPEEYPEEFKIIQSAYQQALQNQSNTQAIEYENIQPNTVNKQVTINIENDSIEAVKKKQINTIDVDIRQETPREFNKEDWYRYVLLRIETGLQWKCSEADILALFQDQEMIECFQNVSFKKEFEKLLFKYCKKYSSASNVQLYNVTKKYQLMKINRIMKWNKQRKELINICIIMFIMIGIMIIPLFSILNNSSSTPVNRPSPPSFDASETANQLFDMQVMSNQAYLNGLEVIKEDSEYNIYDVNGNKVIEQTIDMIEFTMSETLILTIEDKDYLFNTYSQQLNPTPYNEIRFVYVYNTNQEIIGEKLLMNDENQIWAMCDLLGQVEKVLDVQVPEMIIRVTMDENGNITIE